MDDMRTTNYSNSNHFRQNSSYQYHNQIPTPSHLTPHINPPEAQAQLVAFTQPLMSVQVPYQDSRMYQRNYHSTKSYVQNQQPSLSMKSKSETAGAQPEYYMDSFAPNFSDKPSSNSDNTNKTKTKHVTFQEPDVTKSVCFFFFQNRNLILIYLVNHQNQTQIIQIFHNHHQMVRIIHHLLGHHQFLCIQIHVHGIDITILIIIILTMNFIRHIII
jgi:hypothetical protein